MSRGLSDLFDIAPLELEQEFNSNEFARKRVVNRKKYEMLVKAFYDYASQKKNFEASIDVYDSNRQPVTLTLSYTCVSDLSNNIEYILRSTYQR